MAVVTKTLKASGGDYSLMSTWESTEQTDLVADTDQHVLECYDDWASGLDDAVIIEGWTTNATYDITVKTPLSERHTGIPQTGFFMKSAVANGPVIRLSQQGTLIAIDAENTETAGIFNTAFTLAYDAIADRCIGKSAGLSYGAGFYLNSTSKAISCLGYDSLLGFFSGGDCVAVNSVASNCTTGFSNLVTNLAVKNCVAYGCTTSYGSGLTGCTNNAASDGSTTTPPGSNPITTDIVSGDFNDAANDDYHLSSASSQLYHAGVNVSGVTLDIDGDSYHATTPSIGIDEIVAGGAFKPHWAMKRSNLLGAGI